MAPIQPVRSSLFPRAQTAPTPRPRLTPAPGALRRAGALSDGMDLRTSKKKAAPTPWQFLRLRWPFGKDTKRRMVDARVAFVAKDFKRARAKLEKVLAVEPTRYDARLLRALVNASEGEMDTAQAELVDLLRERPYDEDTHLARALLAYNMHDYRTAWASLTQVTVHYPGNSVAWMLRTSMDGTLGYAKLVGSDLMHLRATLPENCADAVVQATRDLSAGLTTYAWHRLGALEKMEHLPPVVKVLEAHITDLLGYRQAAIDLYDEALRQNPSDTASAALRAGALQPL